MCELCVKLRSGKEALSAEQCVYTQPRGHDLGNFQSFVLEQSGCAGKRWDMKFLGDQAN